MNKNALDARVYDAVFETIAERRDAYRLMCSQTAKEGQSKAGLEPKLVKSRTIKLLAAGTAKIGQKLGEEAVETLIEGVRGRKKPLIEESADLLYFLALMWAANEVNPRDVWQELAQRHGLPEEMERAMREASKARENAQ